MAVFTFNSKERFFCPAVWFFPMTCSQAQREIKVLLRPVWIQAFRKLLVSGLFCSKSASLQWGRKFRSEAGRKTQGGYSNAHVIARNTSKAWKCGVPGMAALCNAKLKVVTINSSQYHMKGGTMQWSPRNYKVRRKNQSSILDGCTFRVATYKVIGTKDIQSW